jgi:hypothetical protein
MLQSGFLSAELFGGREKIPKPKTAAFSTHPSDTFPAAAAIHWLEIAKRYFYVVKTLEELLETNNV